MKGQNKYDPFEKLIQDKFESYESSYNKDWESISNKMDKIDRLKNLKKWGLISLICIALVSFFTIGSLNGDSKTKKINSNKKPNKTFVLDKIEKEKTNDFKEKTKEIDEINHDKKNKTITIKPLPRKTIFKDDHIQKEIIEVENFISDEKEDSTKTIEENKADNRNLVPRDTVISISTSDITFCTGDTLKFLISSCDNCKLEWYVNKKFNSNDPNGNFILDRAGTLNFELRAIKEKDTLISNSVDIFIEDVSDLKISFQKIEENQITKYYFNALSSKSLDGDFYWNFGDSNNSNEKYAQNLYQKNGIYKVSLDYVSKSGCTNKVYKNIEVANKINLLAPNSFTPNGDGLNDFFMPEYLKSSGNPFTLTVYNKMGEQIFETKNASNPWNGINQKNGQKCKIDNYIWLVNTINDNGDPEQFRGTILILKN